MAQLEATALPDNPWPSLGLGVRVHGPARGLALKVRGPARGLAWPECHSLGPPSPRHLPARTASRPSCQSEEVQGPEEAITGQRGEGKPCPLSGCGRGRCAAAQGW